MKKTISVILVLFCVLLVGGCNYYKKVEVVNTIQSQQHNKDNSFVDNVKETYTMLNGLNAEGSVTYNKNYDVKLSIIKNGTLENSFVYLSVDDIDVYLKNRTVYVVYKTNVVLKDSLDNFIDEICSMLNEKGLNCNAEKVKEFIKEENMDFSFFDKINEISENRTFKYNNLNLSFDENYLITSASDVNDNISYDIKFDYDKISIKFEMSNELFCKSLSEYDIKNIIDKYYK